MPYKGAAPKKPAPPRLPDAARSQRAAKESRRYRLVFYGLTPEGYEALFVDQGGCCAICRRPLLSTKSTHVDHDHDRPGTHRGLLCQSCNLGLGQFHDSPTLLAAALGYMNRY